LWIRIGFNADPATDPGSQTNADPDPGQAFKTKKVHMKNIGNRSKNKQTKVQKPVLKAEKPGLFVKIF
jgi:hypothetical protein